MSDVTACQVSCLCSLPAQWELVFSMVPEPGIEGPCSCLHASSCTEGKPSAASATDMSRQSIIRRMHVPSPLLVQRAGASQWSLWLRSLLAAEAGVWQCQQPCGVFLQCLAGCSPPEADDGISRHVDAAPEALHPCAASRSSRVMRPFS